MKNLLKITLVLGFVTSSFSLVAKGERISWDGSSPKGNEYSIPTQINNEITPMLQNEFPWSAIGKIVRSDGYECTATIVGTNLLVSTSNCLRGDNVNSLKFYPNYKNGKGTIYSEIKEIIHSPNNDGWAVAILNSRIGLKTGWFGWREIGDYYRLNYSFVGYSQNYLENETAGIIYHCSTLDEHSSEFEHNCFIGDDTEGAPLFARFGDQIQLVGIGLLGSGDFNFAVKSKSFSRTLGMLRERDPDDNKSFIHLCNTKQRGTVTAALAFNDLGGRWVSQGWYELPNGTCKEVYLRNSRGTDISVYSYAYSRDRIWNRGRYGFCVASEGDFLMNDAFSRSCDEEGQEHYSFEKEIHNLGSLIFGIFSY